jgi:hypothetical protein
MSTLQIKGSPTGPILHSDVKTQGVGRGVKFTDDAALRLVNQDTSNAEMYIQQNQWALQWRESDILYQSPRTVAQWENAVTTKANVSRFTVAKHVNSLVPDIMSGIFYDSPPFVLRPRGRKTSQNTMRAKATIITQFLDDIEFKAECKKGITSQVNKGTGIWKYGHYVERSVRKVYKAKKAAPVVEMPFGKKVQVATEESDDFHVEMVEEERWKPFFEYCPLGTVLADGKWADPNQIWKAKVVLHIRYVTFADLNELRGQKGYKVPSEQELIDLFFAPKETPKPDTVVMQQKAADTGATYQPAGRDEKTTEDPSLQTLKLVERWDKHNVMCVLQEKLPIRNEEHEFGRPCFLSANFWDIEGAGYGLGVGRLVGSDQRVDQGATNAALDILSLGVNQQALVSSGANAQTQQIRARLGGIIKVDGDVDKAFKWMDPPKVPSEVWAVIQNAKQSSESTSGADEAFSQGNLPSRGSSIGRTATGAGGIITAKAGRIQGPVGNFVDNVFIPFILILDAMICENCPIAQLREMLDEELGEEFELDVENYLNCRVKPEVLAGAHLAAKKAMAQSLPFLIQIFENPHMLDSLNSMGYTIDVKELFDMLMEMSEWKNTRDVIRKMNPEEMQNYRAAKQGEAMAKVQGDLMKIQAKHAATQEEIDQKADARLADKVVDQALDRATGVELRQAAEDRLEPRARGNSETQIGTTAQ